MKEEYIIFAERELYITGQQNYVIFKSLDDIKDFMKDEKLLETHKNVLGRMKIYKLVNTLKLIEEERQQDKKLDDMLQKAMEKVEKRDENE